MSISTVLYSLFIGPLELFFEMVFTLSNKVINNPGFSIIFLSLAVNFLVLPLYKRADAMQAEEKEAQKRMEYWVSHIKKTFKGDERFMMLQTYYRQNNYKPTDALKGSVSLLLQIPFFIAAYNFLSELKLLQGFSFGPIKDLGAPDAMFVIAGFTINILPILMTVINIVSGIIYTKGAPLKSKIQLYVMALAFLVFLYNSPSGLVFYWTLNNVFSLVKTIFYKLKNPKFVLSILSSITGFVSLIYVMFVNRMDTPRKQLLLCVLLLLLQIPIVVYYINKRFNVVNKITKVTKQDKIAYLSGCLFMTFLTGLIIPVEFIRSSPEEFINTATLSSPLIYILSTFLIAAGTFIVWFGVFYILATPSGKRNIGIGMWLISVISIVNYMLFGTKYGNISPQLKFDNPLNITIKEQILNIVVLLIISSLMYLVYKKKNEIVRIVYATMIFSMVAMSVYYCIGVNTAYKATLDKITANDEMPKFTLSKTGKNIVFFMMDRAIGSYIPYLFNEKPELVQKFDGFTYYPNTMSYGPSTIVGSPSVYGGYDYTPEEMNKRTDELLKDKHAESLKVMPVLFDNNGFDVVVCDPTYAGYGWIPDLSIYDEYPNIKKYISEGKYSLDNQIISNNNEKLHRNLFLYSIFKISPVFAQPTIYSNGLYNDADIIFELNVDDKMQYINTQQALENNSKAKGVNETFNNAYAVLDNLDNMVEIVEENQNTFMMMSNNTTHEPTLLKEPNYEPDIIVDNTDYDFKNKDRFNVDGRELKMENETQIMHYHVNMAAMIKLGEFMDYLKENNLYDNTRIIIVADHGRALGQYDDWKIENETTLGDMMYYNPLLLVKDFNSRDEFKTDSTFMTNADVPTIATEGVIDNPINPFTNNPINSDAKNKDEQYVFASHNWQPDKNDGPTFENGVWYSVKNGNVLDRKNWTFIGENKE